MFKFLSNNIIPPDDIEKYSVYFYRLRKGRVRVNASVVIPEGFQVVVVSGGKVSDVLSVGRHKVNGSTMPVIFHKLKMGVPNKKGKYKKRFKADVFYVNTNALLNQNFTSSSPFHLRSEKFGRIKGYSEGTFTLRVENAEEVINLILRYCPRFKNDVMKQTLANIVGNAVNKTLEKSKVSFSSVLLAPQSLDSMLNPAVENLVGEYGLVATKVKLVSLKLKKRVQKRVNEFLHNRANFVVREDGLEIQDENSLPAQQENEIYTSNEVENEMVPSAPQRQAPTAQIGEKENFSPSNPPPLAPISPAVSSKFLNRRMQNTSLISSSADGIKLPNFNASEVLQDANTFKQCKFCDAKIEEHYQFCPKCGFKQM